MAYDEDNIREAAKLAGAPQDCSLEEAIEYLKAVGVDMGQPGPNASRDHP
jgi:hypothetical protein